MHPLSLPIAPVSTAPTLRTPHEAALCAKRPVESYPPCASPPGHTPPTADPHHSAAQAAVRTSPSRPPCVPSATGSSPARSCKQETPPPRRSVRPSSSACHTALQIRPSSAASQSPPPFQSLAGHPAVKIPPVRSTDRMHPTASIRTTAQSCSVFYRNPSCISLYGSSRG